MHSASSGHSLSRRLFHGLGRVVLCLGSLSLVSIAALTHKHLLSVGIWSECSSSRGTEGRGNTAPTAGPSLPASQVVMLTHALLPAPVVCTKSYREDSNACHSGAHQAVSSLGGWVCLCCPPLVPLTASFQCKKLGGQTGAACV